MFGLSGLTIKLIAGAVLLAALAAGWGYLEHLWGTIADQRTAITKVTTERNQEAETAKRNLDAFRQSEDQRAAETALRIAAEKREAVSRKRVAEISREMERAPTARNQLSPTLRPLLRRVPASP